MLLGVCVPSLLHLHRPVLGNNAAGIFWGQKINPVSFCEDSSHFLSVDPVGVGDVCFHDGGQLHPHPQPCLQSLGRLLHHVHRGGWLDDDDDIYVDDDYDDDYDLHSV